MGDMRDITNEMDDAKDTAESRGLDMEEYSDFSFPESHRPQVAVAMSHWDTGCYHLHEAVKAMKIITDEVEGPEHE
jgi:hypothetical protein